MAEELLFPRLAAPDDRPCLRVGGEVLTYADLAAACRAHARRLAAEGVVPGDRVAVWAQPELATAVALVANAAYGAVSVPLSPKLGDRELAHILGDAAPRLALAAWPGEVAGRVPALDPGSLDPGSLDPRPLDPKSIVTAPIVLESVDGTLEVSPADHAPLLVLYTSGTTGPPKGAVITARNVATNIDALAAAWAWSDRDTVVHSLPLFHVHGLVLGLFGSLRAGGALTWVPRFEPAAVATAVHTGGTMLFAVPTMYHRLADGAEVDRDLGAALGRARLLVSGSAALAVREHRRVRELTGLGVHERYGLTETLIDCAVRAHGPPQPGYVGPPLDGVELRLVDEDRRAIDAWDDATLGEVAVRGPHIFDGYLHRPEATRAALDEDGWFYTGDLATRAPDGSVRIVGRRSTDLIKTGGFRVGAGEVENALLEVEGVREAAVVGVPDEDLGERIVAFVVPRDRTAPPSRETLAEHVAHTLSPHKRPRDVRYVDSLPRNAMGKILKASLRTDASGARGR